MRFTILAVGLVAVCGCGKKEAAGGGPAPIEFEVKSCEAMSDEYRDDPGTDAKYKGKTGRVPFTGNFDRENGKSIARFARTSGAIRSSRQPDLLFRFASEAETARIDKRQSYYIVGHCEGLSNGVVLFTNCRIDGEYTPPPR